MSKSPSRADAIPLLVIDTNVVLDLLHFADPAAQPILRALDAGRVRAVVAAPTLDELRRVLTYPEFALEPACQAAMVARYASLSDALAAPDASAVLPRCSDPDDQKFIDLAAASRAQGLVSKDRAVLRLRRRCAPMFRIMTPVEAVRWLDESVPE